jgi:predicted transposase YbfD/YdcC
VWNIKKKESQTHVLGAVDHETGIHLSQVEVDCKTNEINAIIPLLETLDIEGNVITADALLTQTKIARYIVEDRKADFVFTVKDNQPSLKSDIETLNLKERPCDFDTTNKGHGRLEIRRIWCSPELNEYLEFPCVSQVFCIEREITHLKKEKTTIETVYGITSQSKEKASPEMILSQNRGHWSIENKIHWVLDVTFDEDRSQIRNLNGPLVMTCLKRFSISFLRIHGLKNIAEAFRKLWAKPHRAYNMLVSF